MKKKDDFLVEIHTEELPPKSLLHLAFSFSEQIKLHLQKLDLTFEDIKFFATPRRIAVFVKGLLYTQPDQNIERKGPSLNAAFDKNGNPTKACEGFARSLGISPNNLTTIKNEQGEWVGLKEVVPGKTVMDLLPRMIETIASTLPIPKRMRWGDNDAEFTRPIHSVMMLYGDQIVQGTILGYPVDRTTRGHRFHAPHVLTLMHAAEYEALLRDEGYVLSDFEYRRSEILKSIKATVELTFNFNAKPLIDTALLDEVTGLVEWPVAYIGHFDKAFLNLPPEVLISAMQDHQRYFPIVDKDAKLLPHFVLISNIESHDAKRLIHGNERVLRARLSDASFFYEMDKKETLEERLTLLKGMVFQAKLGTLFDKATRLSKLTAMIALSMKGDTLKLIRAKTLVENGGVHASRAGWLAKSDLTTQMVAEFPELQGLMGYYYAKQDGELDEVAFALKEQYLPRFAGDELPSKITGQALALADRIDTLVGTFGINQIPTGEKDPYGLRRAAFGIIRILIEKQIDVDLNDILHFALSCYHVEFENNNAIPQVLNFIQERLRSWYQEQKNIQSDVFSSVTALGITNLLDIDKRIQAVTVFKKLAEAETLSIANKRVSNILAKYKEELVAKKINPDFFESDVEAELVRELENKSADVEKLYHSKQYEEILLKLATLRKPIDDFFDHVMVMTEDKPIRENRILMLKQVRTLFTKVADIALLQ